MKKRIIFKVAVNKRNNQITSYFQKKKLPESIRKAIDKQPTALRKLIFDGEFKEAKFGD